MGDGAGRRTRSGGLRPILALGLASLFALAASPSDGTSTLRASTGVPYTFNFEGNPSSPQPFNPATWDVAVSNRAPTAQLEGMQAQHGPDCAPYPATHYNDTFEGAVFICRNHLMTAINAKGYGEIVLTPNQLVDFSGGETTIRFDLSTLRTSYRDWVDVWITPFDDNLVLPLDFPVDLQGPPARGIQVKMDQNGGTIFRGYRFDNFKTTPLRSNQSRTLDQLLVKTSATTRTTFELTISATRLRFGAPSLGFNWVDAPMTNLGWTRGIVQLAHHSYNPTKDCKAQGLPACLPNTWHWANFSISNAIPFTLLRGTPQVVNATTQSVVVFPSAAPKSAYLRFAAIGSVDFSVDAGKTWQPARRQAQSFNFVEHFSSYWTEIPAGTRSVQLRGRNWPGGPWWVRDIAIWSTVVTVSAVKPPVHTSSPGAPTGKVVSAPTFLNGALAAMRQPVAVVTGVLLAVLVGAGFLIYVWLVRRRRSRLRSK